MSARGRNAKVTLGTSGGIPKWVVPKVTVFISLTMSGGVSKSDDWHVDVEESKQVKRGGPKVTVCMSVGVHRQVKKGGSKSDRLHVRRQGGPKQDVQKTFMWKTSKSGTHL
jgi:hypothetical protein